MRWPAGPFTVAPGTLKIPVPAGANQALLAGVLINNNSQYLLAVGPSGDWLQPFSSGWFGQDTLNSASLSVTASAVGSQLSAADGQIVTAMFYGADEPPPALSPFAADPITVAESLAATGLPNVLVTTNLWSTTFAIPFAAGTNKILPVADFASLTITTQVALAGPGSRTQVKLDWYQTTDQSDVPFTEYLSSVNGVRPNGAWAIPVNAQSVKLTNSGPNPIIISVYGSNRAVPKTMQLGSSYGSRAFARSGVVTAGGTLVFMTNADGGDDQTNFSGQVYVRAACSGTSGFVLGLNWMGIDGGTHQSYVSPSVAPGGGFIGFVAHPLSVINWVMLPVAPLGGVTGYSLDISQA